MPKIEGLGDEAELNKEPPLLAGAPTFPNRPEPLVGVFLLDPKGESDPDPKGLWLAFEPKADLPNWKPLELLFDMAFAG